MKYNWNLRSLQPIISICVGFFLAEGCVDPVEPQFDYEVGLIYIDALASTAEGSSYVSISESAQEYGVFKNKFVKNATVAFVNSETQNSVLLIEEGDFYLPPADFKVQEGELWELSVRLDDGRTYRSESEQVLTGVEIKEVDVAYDPQLEFNAPLDKFIPGHVITVSFDDPPEAINYYYWRYRTFEKLVNCRVCFNGYLRNGECQIADPRSAGYIKPYYTYVCQSDCWQIRYGNKVKIFADEFTNGLNISSLPVGEVPLFTKRDILIEVQQFAISPLAYQYYQTLKDIIDNNSGINSPLPAALVGNLYNPEDKEEFVLGRFTAAATITKQLFVERESILENQLEDELLTQPEGFAEPTPPPQMYGAPCVESHYRTGRMPQGWVE